MKQKSFFREHWGACVAVPVVFALIAFGILALLSYSFLSPYAGLVQLFMNESEEETGPRDLMAGLEQMEQSETTEPETPPDASKGDTIPMSSITMPKEGDRYGTITVGGTAISCPLYYGSSNASLNRGAGTFSNNLDVGIPGRGRTIFIMGHNHTFFSDLRHAEVGQKVTIKTHYGTYIYEIVDMKPVDYEDSSAYDLSRKEENLILYTCYPFSELGFTRQRYFVYCDYVSGPQIDPTR